MPLLELVRFIPHFIGRVLLIWMGLMGLDDLQAQVPHVLNYQGRITAGGVNFEGNGKFRFAFVGSGSAASQTFWSQDGTSVGGGAPTGFVTLPVSKGLYSVLLGDTSLTGMAAIPASVFSRSDLHLRVWFDDGVNGNQRLTPDQRIAAVGYAIVAGTVADGAITSAKLASGSVTSSHLAAGSVGSAQLSSGAVTSGKLAPGAAASNLEAGGQAGVSSGGVVLSPEKNNSALLTAGYVLLPFEVPTDRWDILPDPDNTDTHYRRDHTAIWTGSEIILWGGRTSSYLNTGARFNLSTRIWTALPTTAAPTARIDHTAVWTGSLMLVWGGDSTSPVTRLNTGGIYNAAFNTWSAITQTNAPTSRIQHSAVWTGTEMIIWGGLSANGQANGTGARYNPVTNVWTEVSTQSAPAARWGHLAVWTGTEMIVWGGTSGGEVSGGGRYNPVTNQWAAVNPAGPWAAAVSQTDAFWTGTEMIFTGTSFGRYQPSTDTWTGVNPVNRPRDNSSMTAVWTGKEIILWGQISGLAEQGARYDLAGDLWRPLTRAGAPTGREGHSAIWTGSQMVIVGNGPTALYTPGQSMFLYQKP